jgi:hypothetical protein
MESASQTAVLPAPKAVVHPAHLSVPERVRGAAFGVRGLAFACAAFIGAASLIAAFAGHTMIAVWTIACLVPLITPITLSIVFELALMHGGLIVPILALIGSLIGLAATIRWAAVLEVW